MFMSKDRMSVIVEFTTVPLGTANTSLSGYVSKACRVVERSGLPFTITPMGTVIEAGSLKEAMEVVMQAHESIFEAGALRVSTSIKIDDRRDKRRCMQDKVEVLGLGVSKSSRPSQTKPP
jgi:uncharacterized protein (TIGR00106 family)